MKKIILSCLLLLGLSTLSISDNSKLIKENQTTSSESQTVAFADAGAPKSPDADWGRTVF